MPEMEMGHPVPVRQSKDQICNYSGLCLLWMINSLVLVQLNGGVEGDRSGEYTFLGGYGASVIDYSIISYDLLNLVFSFKVGTGTESDHLPLITILSGQSQNIHADYEPQLSTEAEIGVSRVRWSAKAEYVTTAFLHLESCLRVRESLLKTGSPEKALYLYQEIVYKKSVQHYKNV